MADSKHAVRTTSPSRQTLLSADKEDLVERIESLQSQLEEASRRSKAARQELEAFRVEILRDEGGPAGEAARPYVYEDLGALPQDWPDRAQLRGLLAAYRRLRDTRDQLKLEIEQARNQPSNAEKTAAEIAKLGSAVADVELTRLQGELARIGQQTENAKAEIEKLNGEIQGARETQARAIEEAGGLRTAKAALEADLVRIEAQAAEAGARIETLQSELHETREAQARAVEEAGSLRSANSALEAELARVTQEFAKLRTESDAFIEEQARHGRNFIETTRLLEAARYELANPEPPAGFRLLEKFFLKARVKPLLKKHVKGRAADLVYEAIGATIGSQAQPLEAVRDLTPRIHRPPGGPSLGELRQLIERLGAADLEGVRHAHDDLRAAFFTLAKRPQPLTLVLDTMELVVNQQPGPARTYWPLVLYVPELREFWHGTLQTAPDTSSKGVADFLSRSLLRMPSTLDRSRLRFRLDERFHSDAVLRLLEAKKCSYVIAVPNSAELRAAARTCTFLPLLDGWEAGEWTSKGHGAKTPPVRFIALRHARAAQPAPALPYLFRDPQHVYHVFAADRKILVREALECYAAREADEEREHALLRDFSVNRMMARGPEAHAAFLPLFLLAADLLQWHRRSLSPSKRE